MASTAQPEFFVGPDTQPDKYRVLTQVGGGGEAALWRAEVEVGGQPETVALKVLRPEHRGEIERISARWAEQAELLRFVTHPNVIGVREHFEGAQLHRPGTVAAGGGPGGGDAGSTQLLCLVMNWVEGYSLRDWLLLREGREGTVAALRLLEQVADALDMLHSGRVTPSGRAVVHGDLSPGNVMVSDHGRAVLVDFGLVRLSTHNTRIAAGTPGFAAPEVWTRGQYSPASDRYSFAALTFFALFGSPPPPDPAEIGAQLFSHPLLTNASGPQVEMVMRGFSDDATCRPATREWLQSLRGAASTSTRASSIGGAASALPPRPESLLSTHRPPSIHTDADRPRGSGRDGGGVAAPARIRPWLWVGAAILALAVILGIDALTSSAGSGDASGPNSSSAQPANSSPPGSAGATSPVTPAPAAVRRQSASPLVLNRGYRADIDSLAPNWDVRSLGGSGSASDFSFGIDAYDRPILATSDGGDNAIDLAPVEGPPEYGTCAAATAYASQVYATPGRVFCLRTNGNRYAYLRIRSSSQTIGTMDVTVWDPPFGGS